MEETNNTLEQQPYYTRQWLTLQVVYSLLIAGLAAIPALAIKELAHDRFTQILLSDRSYNMVTESTYYCSIVVALTLLTLSVIDMVSANMWKHFSTYSSGSPSHCSISFSSLSPNFCHSLPLMLLWEQ